MQIRNLAILYNLYLHKIILLQFKTNRIRSVSILNVQKSVQNPANHSLPLVAVVQYVVSKSLQISIIYILFRRDKEKTRAE